MSVQSEALARVREALIFTSLGVLPGGLPGLYFPIQIRISILQKYDRNTRKKSSTKLSTRLERVSIFKNVFVGGVWGSAVWWYTTGTTFSNTNPCLRFVRPCKVVFSTQIYYNIFLYLIQHFVT